MDEKHVLLAVLVLTLTLVVGGTVSSLSAATLRAHHVPKRAISLAKPKPRHVNPRRTLRLRATAWHW